MSRAERERSRTAAERWPALQDFITTKLADELFQSFDLANRSIIDQVQKLPVERMKLLAMECADFIAYFRDRTDDVHMLLDGLGAKVPIGKIPYEGERPQGTVRIRALYAELARLIRKSDLDWKP